MGLGPEKGRRTSASSKAEEQERLLTLSVLIEDVLEGLARKPGKKNKRHPDFKRSKTVT